LNSYTVIGFEYLAFGFYLNRVRMSSSGFYWSEWNWIQYGCSRTSF